MVKKKAKAKRKTKVAKRKVTKKKVTTTRKKILIEKKNNYGNVRKDIFGKFTWLKTAIEMEKVYKNIL